MSVTPKRNLPPAAEPWGRSVDARVQAIEQASARQRQDNDNTLSGLNSSLLRLSEQVGEIRTITETLVEQQATLQAQQSMLTETVSQLQTVVNGMLVPQTGYDVNRGFTITPTPTMIASMTFRVPNGYTQALIYAVAVTSASNSNADASYLYTNIEVDGTALAGSFNQGQPNVWMQNTTAGSKVQTELVGGSNLLVETKAYTQAPSQTWVNSGNMTRLAVQVLFLR